MDESEASGRRRRQRWLEFKDGKLALMFRPEIIVPFLTETAGQYWHRRFIHVWYRRTFQASGDRNGVTPAISSRHKCAGNRQLVATPGTPRSV